jgi:hypothetical protein
VQSEANFDDHAGDAGRSVARIDGKNGVFSRRGDLPNAKPATFETTGNTAEQNRLKPCTGKPYEVSNELELESQKGNHSLLLGVALPPLLINGHL